MTKPTATSVKNNLTVEPGGTRSTQRKATRQRIIESAIALFAANGFSGTSLPDVASRSSCQVPLIIYHFKTKDGLWRAAVDVVYRRVEVHIDSFTDDISGASGMDFYRLCARAHITALARYPEYMRILFQEGTQRSERLEWLVSTHQHRMTDRILSVIQRAQAEGAVPEMNLDHAKFIFSGAFCLPIVLAPEYALVTGEDALSDEFIERHIEICLQLLLR